MKIVVVGLGYVGCPLAHELSKHFTVIGFDINEKRVAELAAGRDSTNELSSEDVKTAQWFLTTDPKCMHLADMIIVTVPTPITLANVPDLTPVIKASQSIAKHMTPGTIIVFESTVYPGVSEEICVPLLEAGSGMKWKDQFFIGYSPERINPGDKVHTLTTTVKIVSGDSDETLDKIDEVYSKITTTFRASTIKVAEAAKVIENTQRDVNIGLMNELSAIFGRLGIDTHDVIEAAGTKWNFLKFYPGLVGGHCISVDPYYLSHRSQEAGYIPSLILAAREVNDQVPNLLMTRTLQALSLQKRLFAGTVITVLGITFKEGVPDIRNSKVVNVVNDFKQWGFTVQVIDPHADPAEVMHEYGIELCTNPDKAHAVVLAVAHPEFIDGSWNYISSLLVDGSSVVTDVKSVLNREEKPTNVLLVRT